MFKYILTIFITFFILFDSYASIVILNGLTHAYKTEKTKVYSGKLEIQNTASTEKSVKFYLQDLSYSFDGSIKYLAPNTNKSSNAGWIKLSTNLVNLKPKEKVEVVYEIIMPDSIEDAGTYWSTIIAEPVEDINPSHNSGVRITSVIRYAIQILTDFDTDNLQSDIKFEKIHLTKNVNTSVLNIALSNQGKVYSKTTASIILYDSQNANQIGQFYSQPMGLLPGNSKTYLIELPNTISSGNYKAVLFAVDTEENTFAMNVELNI